jgi:NTE family protein
MKKSLAFVLGGGGARGAMQVGALRALFEAGIKPDILVGTSIGAINAAVLALWGVDLAGIDVLEHLYQRMQDSKLLDPRLLQFAWNAVSKQPNHRGSRAARELMIAEGITPEIRFGHINSVRLATVAADLHTGKSIIYGMDPEHSVMEGVLASIAIPPWFAAIEKDDQYIIDGGAVSNLPLEPAIKLGATEIIALDVHDPDVASSANQIVDPLLTKLAFATIKRELHLEMELAAVHGIPVHYVNLRSSPPVQTWEFKTHRDLFQVGYDIMKNEMSSWPQKSQPSTNLLRRFAKKLSSAVTPTKSRYLNQLQLE